MRPKQKNTLSTEKYAQNRKMRPKQKNAFKTETSVQCRTNVLNEEKTLLKDTKQRYKVKETPRQSQCPNFSTPTEETRPQAPHCASANINCRGAKVQVYKAFFPEIHWGNQLKKSSRKMAILRSTCLSDAYCETHPLNGCLFNRNRRWCKLEKSSWPTTADESRQGFGIFHGLSPSSFNLNRRRCFWPTINNLNVRSGAWL